MVDDLWALLLAGEAEGADIVECARQLTSERDLIVWRALVGVLRAAGRLLDGDALTRYRTEVGTIVAPAARELGWTVRPGDDDRARQLRGALYSMLGGFVGDDAVIAHARGIVAAPTAVDAELVAAAVGVVASTGTTAEFETYVERATTPTTIPQEQLRFLHALGDFPDAQLVLRACELALSDSVRPQNAPFLLQRALRNRDHGPAAWAFVRDNWDPIRARFSGSLMSRMLDGCTWLVDDPDDRRHHRVPRIASDPGSGPHDRAEPRPPPRSPRRRRPRPRPLRVVRAQGELTARDEVARAAEVAYGELVDLAGAARDREVDEIGRTDRASFRA